MACPPGQHQHMNSRGKMSACHSIATKHENAKTRQYHDMAIAQAGNSKVDEDFGMEQDEKSFIPKEKMERIKANNKVIRQALNRLTRGKFKSLFVPLTAILWTYDGMSKKVGELSQKVKSKKDKQMADIYSKTVDSILDEMPDIDVDSWGDDTVKLLTEGYREKVDSLKQAIKEKGTKDCPEYAQYRAYKDYLTMADQKQAIIHKRIESERMKTQRALNGTRSVNNRQRKLPDGKIPSKDEIIDKYGFTKKVFDDKTEDRPKTKTKEEQEADDFWNNEIVPAYEKRQKELKEKKEIEELGNRVRTSPNKSVKKRYPVGKRIVH